MRFYFSFGFTNDILYISFYYTKLVFLKATSYLYQSRGRIVHKGQRAMKKNTMCYANRQAEDTIKHSKDMP